MDIVHSRQRGCFRQPQYEEWFERVGGNIARDSRGWKLTDPRRYQVSKEKIERNWNWGLELRECASAQDRELLKIAAQKWSAAPARSACAGTAAGAFSLEGMLGPGLPYPKKLTIPSEMTVVDIITTLSAHAGVTEPDQDAMKEKGEEGQKTHIQEEEIGVEEHRVTA